MNIEAGSTFFAPWPDPEHGVNHLFFVISDPQQDPDRVVCVPLMTWDEYKERSCVLDVGDHPFIRHTSYIDYECAECISVRQIEDGLNVRTFRTHHPADEALLKRIREGADRSDRLASDYWDILERQGLVGA